jgi:hypothetical protein
MTIGGRSPAILTTTPLVPPGATVTGCLTTDAADSCHA